MKRLLCAVLALVMLTSLAMAEPAVETGALPEVGDVLNGFEVVSRGYLALIDADTVLMEHQKTGAQLLLLANEDTNRLYELTFRTPAYDDRGTPHVFEHATLNGSEKYPSPALFFNLSYQTYNTFMNAMTYNFMTTYPVASLSEAQLLRYADFYTDSCFHPMIMEDESIFREEAWRYAMSDEDDDLSLTGTVYSEMLGAMDKESTAQLNFMKTMFPGSTAANESGGVPEAIPDLTWEDLKAYHDAYYHPSNAIAVLYGRFDDYAPFLELLDGYFSAYEREEIVITDDEYRPIEGAVEADFAFPVAAGQDTGSASIVHYGILCPGADERVMDELTTLLAADSSVLMQRLRKALPGGDFSCYYVDASGDIAVVFEAQDVDAADAGRFREIVDGALAETLEAGFAPEAVEAVMAATNLDVKLITESDSIGVNVVPSLLYYWVRTGNPNAYAEYVDDLGLFDDWNEDGTFQDAIEDYLIDNPLQVLCVTEPQAGLQEERDQAEYERLQAIRAEMSDEEIAEIVAATRAAEEPAEDASEYVRQLQAVTVDSLPEEMRAYEWSDETDEEGVRRMDVYCAADGVGEAMLMLDASGLPQEDLHWFKLYVDLIGELDTSLHTHAELDTLMTRYLYGCDLRPSVPRVDEQAQPKLRVSWIATDEDMAEAYRLVGELLFDTQFTDEEDVGSAISYVRQQLRKAINDAPYQMLLYRALATSDDSYRYYTYINFLDYYNFLMDVEAQMAEDPQAVLANLQAVQQRFDNRANAFSGYVGSEESALLHREVADAFLAGMGYEPIEPVAYDLPAMTGDEGIAVESAVNYNLVFADLETMGLDGYSGDLDAVTSLVSDVFLMPLLRDQYGAYGVMHQMMEYGAYIVSYRDPNVAQTYDVYDSLPDRIAEMDIDQETLDGYILSSYAALANSSGEISGGVSWMLNLLEGRDPQEALGWMRQLKEIRAEDIPAYAEYYRALMEQGVRATAGSASSVNQNADRFDVVLNPFGVQDLSETAFEDLPEDHPYYDSVYFAMENGLMSPLDETWFGADEPASMGDLAAGLSAAIGGPADGEEGLATLQQYGILPADAAVSDELARVDTANALYDLTIAMGVEPETPDAEEAPEDEGEAMMAWAIYMGYLEPLSSGDEAVAAPDVTMTRAELAGALDAFLSALA